MTTGMRGSVVFRVDASIQIGIGHVMRCLTLAEALREWGHACHFVCRDHSGNLINLLRQRDFPVHVLPMGSETVDWGSDDLEYACWLGVSWEADAQQSGDILGELDPAWLVVDHYALDARWEAAVRQPACQLLVIDDLANRRHVADLLLDQNMGRASADYAGLVPENCRLLTGPRYALLRPEFAQLREESLRRRQSPYLKRILVTMGGVDNGNATGAVLDALRDCPLPDHAEIDVVMGRHAPQIESVRAQAAAMPWRTRLFVDVSDMAKRMVEADLAIGAAGSTSWERCCLGLPTVLVVLAENQRLIAESLHACGAGHMISSPDDVGLLPRRWGNIAGDTALAKTAAAASQITEGDGTERVIEAMASENP